MEADPRPIVMNIALIDLQAPGIRFKLTPQQGSRDTRSQTTLDFLSQENAQVAVNCHFFLPFPAAGADVNVVGFAASEGNLYSPFEPQPVEPKFLDQSYAILPRAPAMNIDPQNHVTMLHANLGDASGRSWLEASVLGNAFSGSAQIVTHGVVSLPHYGVGPETLTPRFGYSEDSSWYDYLHGRTAIGVSRDGRTLVLFTVDSAGLSWGMTVGEVAEVMIRDYDVVDALNLDGDGSTTLVMQDPETQQGVFMNHPGEQPFGRIVGSSLAVFALPLPIEDGPVLTLVPAPPGCVRLSWSPTQEGWRLESMTDLQWGVWTAVSTFPFDRGDRLELSLPVSAASAFFRLSRAPSLP